MPTSTTTSISILISIFFIFSTYLAYHNVQDQNLHMRYRPDALQKNLTILLWHWPFGHSYSLKGDKCREMYNISNCFLSDNPSVISTADVVVFHHFELSTGRSSLPLHSHRTASQHWVWLSLEPPINNGNLTPYNGLFNWTMSYRRDADIFIPYGRTIPRSGYTPAVARQNHWSCLVSWVVSTYKSQQVRSGVYQNLKKHVPIEVYGRWNKRPLSDKNLLPTIARCPFYLAFENSRTTDYISEKLWRNSFHAGVVPVVLGPNRSTYEALAPPGSFIHVNDFNSIAELAAYIKNLSSDRKAYEVYFKWHRTHSIKTYTDWRERLCQICVNYNRLPTHKVYYDLDNWANS